MRHRKRKNHLNSFLLLLLSQFNAFPTKMHPGTIRPRIQTQIRFDCLNFLGEKHLELGSLLLVEEIGVDGLVESELLTKGLELREIAQLMGVNKNAILLLKLSFHFYVCFFIFKL